MVDSSKTSWLKVNMNHSSFNTLKLHTNLHTFSNGTTENFNVPISIAQNPDEYVHKILRIHEKKARGHADMHQDNWPAPEGSDSTMTGNVTFTRSHAFPLELLVILAMMWDVLNTVLRKNKQSYSRVASKTDGVLNAKW